MRSWGGARRLLYRDAAGLWYLTHYRDRCRVAGLPQINADVIARLTRLRAQPQLAHRFEMPPGRHAAAMRAPHCNGERQNKIVVFAGASIEGQMTSHGIFDTKILQLADQGLGFCELAVD